MEKVPGKTFKVDQIKNILIELTAYVNYGGFIEMKRLATGRKSCKLKVLV